MEGVKYSCRNLESTRMKNLKRTRSTSYQPHSPLWNCTCLMFSEVDRRPFTLSLNSSSLRSVTYDMIMSLPPSSIAKRDENWEEERREIKKSLSLLSHCRCYRWLNLWLAIPRVLLTCQKWRPGRKRSDEILRGRGQSREKTRGKRWKLWAKWTHSDNSLVVVQPRNKLT